MEESPHIQARCWSCGEPLGSSGNCPVCGRLAPELAASLARIKTALSAKGEVPKRNGGARVPASRLKEPTDAERLVSSLAPPVVAKQNPPPPRRWWDRD